jgi:hypothetical protein
MTWLDGFKADLLRVVQQQKPHAVEITDWEEEERSGGYCETCAYTETIVEVTFKCDKCDERGHFMSYSDHMWTYSGGLAELMRMLVDE